MSTSSQFRKVVGRMSSYASPVAIPRHSLTVFNAHSTPAFMRSEFIDTLLQIEEEYDWLPAYQIPDYVYGRLAQTPRPLATLTFDDGFADNMWSAEVLAERNISAAYFIPTGFITSDDPWDFLVSNIGKSDYSVHPSLTPRDLLPMSRSDLGRLSQMGHVIGSHTVNHSRIQTMSNQAVHKELSESKDSLRDWLGSTPTYFASPFSTMGLTAGTAKIVREVYDYHFTTLDIPNAAHAGHFIFRTNLEFWWDKRIRQYSISARRLEHLRWMIKTKGFREANKHMMQATSS